MGEVKGFQKYTRKDQTKQPVEERVQHYNEFSTQLSESELKSQGARCMDCGVPFCNYGCPLGNVIPEFNELVSDGQWQEALKVLLETSNFPEFTGKVCPALCEASCVLSVNDDSTTIKNIEIALIEKGFAEGWIKPMPPKVRSDKNVAVVGSGPAGLAAADMINKAGHNVTVFEKNEVCGGLLRLGIPDFKLDKDIVERRINLMKEEGIEFKTGVNVGVDVKADALKKDFDAVVLTGGAEEPRDLPVPGRELKGIYQAMDFLSQQNRRVGNREVGAEDIIAKGKKVVVIGGGDTGSDCVGTSNRQGAESVFQIELLPEPPKKRDSATNPWPLWPVIKRISTSHEEGVEQMYCVSTKEFIGDENGNLKKLKLVKMEFGEADPKTGRRPMSEVAGSEFEYEADLVFLAIGFLGPKQAGLVADLGVETDERSNVKADMITKMTSVDGIFAAGDMHTGQSLVVRAIANGRAAAEGVKAYLKQK